MYMDNNENYESIAGPLIANFHLHHKKPRYKDSMILLVYFNETGSKVWLVLYLSIVVILLSLNLVHPVLAYTLTYIGILSSVAEVSHYLSHNGKSSVVRLLGKLRILLPIRYHARHHLQNNISYAFLNGITDPLIDLIAAKMYAGYKLTTDRHYEKYTGVGSKNR